jgi:hypothetical protein
VKFRRMCGGGIYRRKYLLSFRKTITATGVIWDWPGVAFILRDKDNEWPRQGPTVLDWLLGPRCPRCRSTRVFPKDAQRHAMDCS